jgi:6-phosphogluconolactonase
MTVVTFDSFEQLARITLPYLLKGNIALSGGSTYGRLFPLWTALNPDCSGATFFPVDERLVDFDDPQSNWGTAYRRFLSRVGRTADRVNFATGAKQYGDLLKAYFQTDVPVFDTVFLGVGDDGHTASLFPGGQYLDDFKSMVLETESPKPPFGRVTLALAPLIAAKTLVVIVGGEEKRHIVQRIVSGDNRLPIVKILSHRKNSLLFFENDLLS